MRIWRISNYADLSGRGGLIADGRWHRRGTLVVYCADHPATAMLERLVHLDPEDAPNAYRLLEIEVDAPIVATRVNPGDLPDDWREDRNVSQAIGSDLLAQAGHLLIWVPSALVPQAWNVLLAPNHKDADRCRIAEVYEGVFDRRLFP